MEKRTVGRIPDTSKQALKPRGQSLPKWNVRAGGPFVERYQVPQCGPHCAVCAVKRLWAKRKGRESNPRG